MTSIENMLLTPFENLKIMDELDNEYNIKKYTIPFYFKSTQSIILISIIYR